MLNHLLQITPLCLMIAVIATVYMRILAYEPILSKWFRWGASQGIDPKTGARKWWYKPLFECEKCLAGQLGLWSYLIYTLPVRRGPVWFYFAGSEAHPVHLYYVDPGSYDLLCHAYTICASILLAIVVSVFYNRIKAYM